MMQKLLLVLGLVATLGLLATSAYAQPGPGIRNEVGVPPPTFRADTPRESGPSMPQPGIQRQEPQFIGGPQPSVSGSNGPPTGCNAAGENCTGVTGQPSVSQINALPVPSVTMYNGVGPLPANVARAPTPVGATGVTTPMLPLPTNDAKGPTSVVDGVIESVAQSKEAAVESFINNVENLEVRN
ncbi:hypothetical protein [Polynucleobacter sp. 80A-SIGWE]|uniref:hypothetical protein n=1 Tax=Polynucleobacter sp. 80A-SIGWE TaxID=2689100 RepID=UPI001C0D2BE4|nr:hypothetical protein [Polynucleobacter sp. 80A-SIGWE]MBU3590005.1 hypothetical protein [Polynucleobacter sp. 80A-SIGWE]